MNIFYNQMFTPKKIHKSRKLFTIIKETTV